MTSILIADSLAQRGIDMISERHPVSVRIGMSEAELLEAVSDVSGLIVRSQTQVTADVIASATQLEVIGRAGVGVDNIDVDTATERGVIVVNAPLANTISAAEHAFALMLALARNVPQGDASLRGGRWERSLLMGVELAGSTLGIIGLGRIGSEVARRARSFDMRVVAYDPFVSSERAAVLAVEMMDLSHLLAESDFVTLHTALHEGTQGLLGAAELKQLKPGARIINAARGALIDEEALYEAIESGAVAGAAIDVFSEEPAVGNILTTSDRIVVTPHLAASTVQAQDRAAITVAEQVLAVLDGQPARFAVNAPLVDPETMAVIGPYIDAAEIASCIAAQLVLGPVTRAHVQYLGEIANHELSLLRAAVTVGMLGRVSDEKVTIVNADRLASQYGLRLDEESGPAREPYANLVVVQAFGASGEMTVSATHTPQGVRVVGIGEYQGVDISPSAAPYVLAIDNVDRPGMVGRIGATLGSWDVNVNYMSVAPGDGQRALMVLGVNRPLNAEELEEVSGIEDVFEARLIDLS